MPTIQPKHPARSRGPGARLTRARRALVLVALPMCVALLVAACGGSSGNSSGSSPSGTSQAASSGGSGTAASTADSSKAEKFSQCMRANGVPDFPDPGANGVIQLTVTQGSDLDPRSAAFKSALSNCKSLEPPNFLNAPGSNPANQSKLLKFVDCMRKDGVPNFPDPGSQGQLVVSSSSGIDPKSPAFQNAMQKCRSLLPNGGAGARGG